MGDKCEDLGDQTLLDAGVLRITCEVSIIDHKWSLTRTVGYGFESAFLCLSINDRDAPAVYKIWSDVAVRSY